jgi:oxygen-independent coproporphyrinogen-3 oxidase
VRHGEKPAVDPEAALRQHRIAVSVLDAAGLHQYEVSNYAQAGEECRHNLVYWRRGHYLGAGLGAHGHLPAGLGTLVDIPVPPGAIGLRYWHGRSLPAYVEGSRGGALPIQGSEAVTAADAEAERILLGLRLAEGIAVSGPLGERADALVEADLLWRRDGRLGTTAQGQEVLDEVIRQLVT